MKTYLKCYLVVFLVLALCPVPILSCTVMQLKQSSHLYHAKNLDWPKRTGTLVLSPRNKPRQADTLKSAYHALKWKTRYGSAIIHGQIKKELGPTADGINEKGLAVSALIWMRSKYPNNKNQAALDSGHVVQYLLDRASSVNEAIHKLQGLNIVEGSFQGAPLRLHYFLSDKSGDSAVVEYSDGELMVTPSNERPLLTNDAYAYSQVYLKDYDGFGGTKPLPGGYSSKARYVRAATFLERLPKKESDVDAMLGYGFDALNDVGQPPYVSMTTEYSAVFDLTNAVVYFKSVNNPFIRIVRLKAVDFSRQMLNCRFDVFALRKGELIKGNEPCLGKQV